MAELIAAPFRDLVTRLYREPATQDTLFELPHHKWYRPAPDDPDLSVAFHDARAGNPSGPAAGPHTQMAQNILLSYVAGGRTLELKTVQVNDRLTISQPCIDVTNVGCNIEWPQELSIEDALREYVAGSMLIEMFRHNHELSGGRRDGLSGAVVYDISVGYDLAGIRHDKVRGFLKGMRAAGALIERLRAEISPDFPAARDLRFPTRLSGGVTLSTFHHCPADEIEKICEFLIAEHDFDVTVKMNPLMLGRERLEHLLHDVLGYTELRAHPAASASGPTLQEGVELCRRLTRFAAQRGRRVGFKFCYTLEVRNHRHSKPENEVMSLSGQPLHVIALTLADEFRKRVGPHVPISFSAGIDRTNFAAAVACGFVPVSACTDLLRPGGYGRLSTYLQSLTRKMQELDAVNIDEFILRRFGQADEARRRAAAELGGNAAADELHAATVRWAGLLNTSIVAKTVREDPRYRPYKDRSVPQRIDSHLATFDCITCYECIPVCPNAANFAYPTPVVSFDYNDVIVFPDGSWRDGPPRRYAIARDTQIACYADFCNECGNCDTFCPEYGGPHVAKPSFHGSVETWARAAPRDGFVLKEMPEGGWIRGRVKGRLYQLTYVRQTQQYLYDDGVVEARLSGWGHHAIGLRLLNALPAEHQLDLGIYHTLRYLRDGVLDPRRVNQINVAGMERPLHASGTPR
ncbi:MAG: glutamate synthase [Phycisphaerae bacterium]